MNPNGWGSSISLPWELRRFYMFFLTGVNPFRAGKACEPAALDSLGFCWRVLEARDKHLGPRAPFPLLWNPAWSLKFSTLRLWLQTLELLQFPDLKTAPPPLRPPPHPRRSYGVVTSAGAQSPDCRQHSKTSSSVTLQSAPFT